MSNLAALDDREVDALLSGSASVPVELAPLAELARALRGRAAAEPVPAMGAALRAQLADPVVVAIDVRRAARRALVKAGAAAAVAAVVVLTGVGAAQNRLPARVQDVLSSTAELVGIDLPHAADRSAPQQPQGGSAVDADEQGHDGQPGYDGVTPGGADPADPGVPGDGEPATPATPATPPDKGQQGESDTAPSTVPETPDRPDNTPSSTVPDKPEKDVLEEQGGNSSVEVGDLGSEAGTAVPSSAERAG